MNAEAEKLNGWKEIACHMNRSVRCVQRWERNERLPVRRHGHVGGVSVYAFREELDEWWQDERRSSREFCIERTNTAGKKKARGAWTNEEGILMTRQPREGGASKKELPGVEQVAWEIAALVLKFLETLTVRERLQHTSWMPPVSRPGPASTLQTLSVRGFSPLT